MRFFDASSLKTKTATAAGLSITLHQENDQKNQPLGKPEGIVFHWTAGDYNDCYDGYHFCIAYDAEAKQPVVVRMLKWSQKGKHLWGYNTGMVGISFCAMADGVMLDAARMRAAKFPVPAVCVEAAATLAAEICAWKKIDPVGRMEIEEKIARDGSLVATGKTITVPRILDHATIAKACKYYPDRWDVHAYYPQLVTRTQAIFRELKGAPMPGGGQRQFNFESLLS